jgi:phenylpropionate dioxygenase-like ring-hydroxylating dioxygenase large terminal subunit
MNIVSDPPARGPTQYRGGPSTQDILHRDGRPVSALMEIESPRFLGDEDIAFSRYTSQDFFDREMERMWTRTWQWACREEQIPERGDYYVYEVGRHSVLIVRDHDNSIKAYVNSCLHRGTKFRMGGTDGSMDEIRCPFHGWTWTLGGELKRVPSAWDAPHVTACKFALPKVKVGAWGGFIFINMDENAESLEAYLAPMPEHLAHFKMEDRYIELHIEKELHANWKVAQEAFLEGYHVQETHPQLLFGSYDEAMQNDVFSAYVSRYVAAIGVASPHFGAPLTEQEQIDKMVVGDRSRLKDELTLRDGETARVVMARVLRKLLGEVYKVDLSAFTDGDITDQTQYSVFPNMLFQPQHSIPIAYRFRPIGNSPDRSLLELFMLRPRPDNGPRPEPSKLVRLAEGDSFTTVPGLDPLIGYTFDQDVGNVRAQQEGCRAARKTGETLLNYQEVRIRLLHQTLETYLNDPT